MKTSSLLKQKLKPLAPSFGVEMKVDLRTLSGDQPLELLELLRRHKLIVIRGQRLDEEALIALGKSLGRILKLDGELKGNDESRFHVNRRSEIGRVSNRAGMLGGYELGWHGDLAHHPKIRYPGRILYGAVIPRTKSVTKWVDLEYGWKRLLTAKDRKLLQGKKGIYDAGYKTDWGTTVHSIVRRHPARETYWAALDESFFRGFSGMDPLTSQLTKARILSKLLVPSAQYRHSWKPGDVIIYENEGTAHSRDAISSKAERTLWRLTLEYSWKRLSRLTGSSAK